MKDKFLLALLVPYLAIGAVVCHEVDGKMVCSGTGQLEADIGGNYLILTNLVVTNVLGVCTNCVSMSPLDCLSMKQSLTDNLSYSQSELQLSSDIIRNADQYVYYVIDNLYANDYPDQETIDILHGVDNDLYLESERLARLSLDMQSILSDVSSIDCSACQMYSPTVVTNNNYIVITNEGSITSGDWATYDQMDALIKSVKDIQTFVRNIKVQIEKQHATISNFWKETHRDLQGISNIVHRLDDYARGDFSNSIYHININVGEIVKAITNLNRNLFIDQQYSNATYYVDLNNEYSPMADLREKLITDDGNKFDYGEFGNLSWFQRVEFLLLEISGLNNLTNALKDDERLNNEARENYKSAKNLLESVASQGTDLEASISTLGNSVKRFASAFQFPVEGAGELVLVPNFWSKMPGFASKGRSNLDLILPVDSRLRETLRVLSSLLWTSFALIILYKMTIYWINFFWDAWDRFMKTAITSVK